MPGLFRKLLLALAAAAFLSNAVVCWKVYRHEPLREAASRALMAERSSFFFDSSLAEPVPVSALKLAIAAGADQDLAIRLEGLAAYAALFAATFFFLRARFGWACAVMGAMLAGANPYLGYYAVRGSSHIYALLFLVVFWGFVSARPLSRGAALAAGLAGGLACLSRMDSAWALLLMAALAWAVERKAFPLKQAGLALGLAFVLVLPYAAWQRHNYGNALYAQELGLRRWANLDRFGYDPAAVRPQGPLGPAAFLFRNGPAGALSGSFGGLGRALAYELPRAFYYKPMLVFVFLGFYAAFALRKDPLTVFAAGALLPVLPIAGIDQVSGVGGIELRYYLPALWALCAAAGLGLQETLDWAEARMKEGKKG
jgi:hypothetical protein